MAHRVKTGALALLTLLAFTIGRNPEAIAANFPGGRFLLLSPATRMQALLGLAVVLIGVPVFHVWRGVEGRAVRG